jgi:hypothetical protein
LSASEVRMELLPVYSHGGHVCASEHRKIKIMKMRKKLRDGDLERSFVFSPLIKTL